MIVFAKKNINLQCVVQLHSTIVNYFSKKTTMSTFSYTIDHIDQIFESANRCGTMRREWFKLSANDDGDYPIYLEKKEKIQEIKHDISVEEKNKNKDEDKILLLKEELTQLNDNRCDIESEIKEDILKCILKHDFKIHIEEIQDSEGKNIYITGEDRDSFFVCKMINEELQKIYKIRQPNRNTILKNLKLLLEDNVDKMLVRGDIKGFFESIPSDELLSKISGSGFVTHRSIKLMKRMFYELSHRFYFKTGVPRGISFSSSLADIYLREIDLKVNQLGGVYFYQRYVDDIIIIASPTKTTPTAKSLFRKVKKIFKDANLELHTERSEKSDKFLAEDLYYDTPGSINLKYLGYSISLDTKTGFVNYKLKETTFIRYEKQMNIAIDYYVKYARRNPRNKNSEKSKGAQKKVRMRHLQPLYKFYKMLGYLTCNYYLGGSKSNILSGIYFKHSLLTEYDQLIELDKMLYHILDEKFDKIKTDDKFKGTDIAKIKDIINHKYSFEKGFLERRMCHLTSADFKMIKHILKNEKKKD